MSPLSLAGSLVRDRTQPFQRPCMFRPELILSLRPLLSQVDKQLQEAGSKVDGSSFLNNVSLFTQYHCHLTYNLLQVFAHSPDEPNIMTFMLSRSEMGTVDGGIFTIGRRRVLQDIIFGYQPSRCRRCCFQFLSNHFYTKTASCRAG